MAGKRRWVQCPKCKDTAQQCQVRLPPTRKPRLVIEPEASKRAGKALYYCPLHGSFHVEPEEPGGPTDA